jgi:hypothetical protein
MSDQQAHSHTHDDTSGHGHDHASGECDTTGRHGMLLFGEDALYLSHLPMYMCPHNFQVVLEVELDEVTAKTLRDDRERHGNGQYTVDPAEFAIAELDPHGSGPERTSFEASLVRGHFERGGTPIATGVTINVRQVVWFSELDLDAKPDPDEELRYLCFGRSGRFYLAHELTARPNYDHLVTARLVPGTVTTQLGAALADDVAALEFDVAHLVGFARDHTVEHRLAPGEVATGNFRSTSAPGGARGFTVDLEIEHELYLEINELA